MSLDVEIRNNNPLSKVRILILFLFTALPLAGMGQVFYVEPTKFKYERKIEDQLKYEGYTVTAKKDFANYIVVCFTETSGKYNSWHTYHDFKGNVAIINASTGEEVSRSRDFLMSARDERSAGYMMVHEVAAKYMRVLLRPIFGDDVSSSP